MFVYVTDVEGNCGIGVVCDFHRHLVNEWKDSVEVKDLCLNDSRFSDNGSGTGYMVAGFINNELCHAIYEQIKVHHKIVFQSEVRNNVNSDNQFFFVVFDVLTK